ncbi:MAG: DUF4124 domain-containing protein [Polaromonas sp.]|nr:DUF4124 domain-containing protein [Polaromonas sp.]
MPFSKALTVTSISLACLAGAASAQGIYTCVDGKGRKITADRPIAECMDRTQQELNRTGTVRRQVGPSLTAEERAVQEEKDKAAAEVRAREAEEKRRDRALLLRYPSRTVHDQERVAALAQVDEVIKASHKRTLELAEQRKSIQAEFEFYAKDPSKAPQSLKRKLEENDNSSAVQKRFILEQEQEKKRVNVRFDEELVKLKPLWALAAPPAGVKSAAQN